MTSLAEEFGIKPGHANWLEAFQFTRVSELPDDEKTPPKVQGLLSAKQKRLLEDAGFQVDAMGGSSFALKEYPDIFKEEEAKDVFLSLLEEMTGKKIEDKKNSVLATLACKTAIKAGESLSFDKMTYLIEELVKTKNPSLCPHGRPIQVKIDKATIEKGLKRN